VQCRCCYCCTVHHVPCDVSWSAEASWDECRWRRPPLYLICGQLLTVGDIICTPLHALLSLCNKPQRFPKTPQWPWLTIICAHPPSPKNSFGVDWKPASSSGPTISENIVLKSVSNWTEPYTPVPVFSGRPRGEPGLTGSPSDKWHRFQGLDVLPDTQTAVSEHWTEQGTDPDQWPGFILSSSTIRHKGRCSLYAGSSAPVPLHTSVIVW